MPCNFLPNVSFTSINSTFMLEQERFIESNGFTDFLDRASRRLATTVPYVTVIMMIGYVRETQFVK